MKQIAHVVRRFSQKEWGGTESCIFHIAQELIPLGFQSSLFTTDMFSSIKEESIGSLQVKRFSYTFPWFGLTHKDTEDMIRKGGSPLSLSLFWHLLHRKNLSVIHTHSLHRLGGIARTCASLMRIPYVVSLHGGYVTLPEKQKELMKKPFYTKWEWGKCFGWLFGSRKVLDDADAIVCCSHEEYSLLKSRFPSKNVVYIPNGVDIPSFEKADQSAFRTAFNVQDSEKIILSVSRIDQQKDQKTLLEAFQLFAQKHPEYILFMIGAISDTQYYQELLDRITTLNLHKKVRIIPGLDYFDPQLKNCYKAADFFVLSSIHEPFGIVLLESWAASCPVITTYIGGIKDFVRPQENALIYKPQDVQDLVNQMIKLANDKALKKKLQDSGLLTSQNYSWQAIAKMYADLYKELIAQKK